MGNLGPYLHQLAQLGYRPPHTRKSRQQVDGTADRLADWLEHNVPEGLAVFTLPEPRRSSAPIRLRMATLGRA